MSDPSPPPSDRDAGSDVDPDLRGAEPERFEDVGKDRDVDRPQTDGAPGVAATRGPLDPAPEPNEPA